LKKMPPMPVTRFIWAAEQEEKLIVFPSPKVCVHPAAAGDFDVSKRAFSGSDCNVLVRLSWRMTHGGQVPCTRTKILRKAAY
jgi:hypothetical protein